MKNFPFRLTFNMISGSKDQNFAVLAISQEFKLTLASMLVKQKTHLLKITVVKKLTKCSNLLWIETIDIHETKAKPMFLSKLLLNTWLLLMSTYFCFVGTPTERKGPVISGPFVSLSVRLEDILRTVRWIFLNFCMKLGTYKGKKLTELNFWKKIWTPGCGPKWLILGIKINIFKNISKTLH